MIDSSISKEMGFWELLGEYKKIEIPILQRDYAQGRKDKIAIREKFLSAIHSAVVSPEPQPLKLDFIYGDVKDGIFRPLDGQQRLTTLFLIYWYVANKENKLNDIKSTLGKFGYETRVSSRDFCRELANNQIAFNGHLSGSIRDCSWYYLSWDKDPTISGMLTMLDAINEKFSENDNLWERLICDTLPVQFNFINLKDFGLSDDLYIKMNARGKQLTVFENFKALFEKKISNEQWDQEQSVNNRFPIKIDGNWTDLFWKHRKNNHVDIPFVRFIALSLIGAMASDERTEERDHLIHKLRYSPENIMPDHFNKKYYKKLYDWLEAYCSNGNDTRTLPVIPFWSLLKRDETLLSFCIDKDNLTWAQLVLFFAQSEYLVKYPDASDERFFDWIRVIRNIIQNSRIRELPAFQGAINLVREILDLIEEDADIYSCLNVSKIESNFASDQTEEELIKARVIMKYPEIKKLIHRAEDTSLCQGSINFVLYCATEEKDISIEKIEKVVGVIEKHFSSGPNDELRRALLTVGSGNYYEFNRFNSYPEGVWRPRYCLLGNMAQLQHLSNNKIFRHNLQELIEKLFDNRTLRDVLDEYINVNLSSKDMKTWRERLIIDKNNDLKNYSRQKYLVLSSGGTICYLLPCSRVNHDEKGKPVWKEI